MKSEDQVKMWTTATSHSQSRIPKDIQLDAALAGAEIAHELNGGDRRDCSYPPELVALLDDPSIDNEAALARWAARIIAKRFSASDSITAREVWDEAIAIVKSYGNNAANGGFRIRDRYGDDADEADLEEAGQVHADKIIKELEAARDRTALPDEVAEEDQETENHLANEG